MLSAKHWSAIGILLLPAGFGCSKKEPPQELAAVASAALEAPKAATATALTFAIDAPTSSIKFLMDSPLEKIDGDAPGSASGELSIEPSHLSHSSGLVAIDLGKLTLYQQKRPSGAGEYQERAMNPLQNEHAHAWLQIEPVEGEVTADQAAKNRRAELRIEKVEPSVEDVTTLPGADRKVTATVSGTLRLHGRQAPKSAKVELTFHYAGDKLESVAVKTLEPFTINLEQFEIHPRDGAGKLVKTITEALATTIKGKVKSEAPVVVEFSARTK